jgi:hypothetical protein
VGGKEENGKNTVTKRRREEWNSERNYGIIKETTEETKRKRK